MKIRNLTVAMALILQGSNGYSWGSYGHEQINSAAVNLLKGKALGTCLARSRDYLVRLAVTPDLDWKMSSQDFFALKVYTLAEKLPGDPKNIYLLESLNKILLQEAKAKKKVLTEDLVVALGKNPSDQTLLNRLKDQEQAAGKLGKLSYAALQKKKAIDRLEHSMHFWEADAYAAPNTGDENLVSSSKAILNLKVSGNFDGDMLADFGKMLSQNIARIEKVDASKKSSGNINKDVIQHGTAPWRAASLIKMAAQSLTQAVKNKSEKDFNRALRLLGTLGHYVGDMGQPFHATLNYDGQGTGPDTMGIHSVYEEKILERQAKNISKSKQDKDTRIWSPMDATSSVVDSYAQSYLKKMNATEATEDQVVKLILTLVADGYDLIGQLLPAFKQARLADAKYRQLDLPLGDSSGERKSGSRTAVHAITIDKFMETMVKPADLEKSVTVLETAEKRMGEASAVLAQIWLMAQKISKVSDSDLAQFCPAVELTPEFAVKEFREQVIFDYPMIDHHKPLSDFDKRDSAVSGGASQQDQDDAVVPAVDSATESEENN